MLASRLFKVLFCSLFSQKDCGIWSPCGDLCLDLLQVYTGSLDPERDLLFRMLPLSQGLLDKGKRFDNFEHRNANNFSVTSFMNSAKKIFFPGPCIEVSKWSSNHITVATCQQDRAIIRDGGAKQRPHIVYGRHHECLVYQSPCCLKKRRLLEMEKL